MSKDQPAFPNTSFGSTRNEQRGMTLRDYFAAKAMQAFIASNYSQDEINRYDEILVSAQSYLLADYMLEARQK